ncbi:MAG: nitroreductase family protein [Polyangiaceae bacterium]
MSSDMEFRELANLRHSTRAFDARPVSDADLLRILATAERAPSAGNLQSYQIVVVRDLHRRARLGEAAHEQRFIVSAPVHLVFLADTTRSSARYADRGWFFAVEDATLAAAYAQLAAADIGLASAWIGSFDDEEVQEILSAPKEATAVCILAVGHGAEASEPTSRLPIREVVRAETCDGRAWTPVLVS